MPSPAPTPEERVDQAVKRVDHAVKRGLMK